MRNARWRGVTRLVALAAALPLVWGCFKYKETLSINPGGDGNVVITADIPEDVAGGYRDATKVADRVPPPVSAGMITQLMLGEHVRLAKCEVELKDGKTWHYDVKLDFDTVAALSAVRYFKDRGLSMDFLGGKRLKFSETLAPNLVDMAESQAKLMPNDAYAGPLLAVADSNDFHNVTDGATMTYEIALPGSEPNAESAAGVPPSVTGKGDATSASWDFTMGQLQQKGAAPPQLAFTVTLPGEYGPLAIVIALLILSLVGILIPSIRLLMIKTRRAA